MSHVFRLLIQGEEILRDQTLHTKLKEEDKEFVMDIKNGKYSYEELLSLAETKMLILEGLYITSKLPHSPDFNKANKLLVNIIENFY